MTSPHGSGGEPTSRLAVYDLHDAPKSNGLPFALGQLILAIGVATLLFGLWALASTSLDGASTVVDAPETRITDTSNGTADDAADDSENSDGENEAENSDGGGEGDDSTGGEPRFDCNDDRSVCRFTTPAGYETYVCIEPCVLPEWAPDDAFVILLTEADGVDGTDFGVDSRGALLPLEPDHGRTAFLRFIVRPDGGIGLVSIGDGTGIPIRFGVLEPRSGTRSADPAAASEDNNTDDAADPEDEANEDNDTATEDEAGEDNASDESGEPDGGGAGGAESGLSLGGLAPLLILLGVGLIGVAAVILVQAAKRRAEEDGAAQDDLTHAPPAPDGLDTEPADEADLSRRNLQVAQLRVKKITDLIAELRADPDPARAIQRAYAALETGFGNPSLSRRPSETCATYLHRTIGVVGGVSQPLRTLTTLFELARFSDATIDEQMRADAIDALVVVRDAWQSRAGRSGSAAPNDAPNDRGDS